MRSVLRLLGGLLVFLASTMVMAVLVALAILAVLVLLAAAALAILWAVQDGQ